MIARHDAGDTSADLGDDTGALVSQYRGEEALRIGARERELQLGDLSGLDEAEVQRGGPASQPRLTAEAPHLELGQRVVGVAGDLDQGPVVAASRGLEGEGGEAGATSRDDLVPGVDPEALALDRGQADVSDRDVPAAEVVQLQGELEGIQRIRGFDSPVLTGGGGGETGPRHH